MTNLRTIVATGLRSFLIANGEAEKLALLADDIWGYRIFLQQAPGDADMPYIVMQHTYGGERRRTPRPEFEHLWDVSGYASDQNTAEQLHSLIYDTLVRQRPPFDENWLADQNVNDQGEIADVDGSENVQRFKAGNYLQVRGSKRIEV